MSGARKSFTCSLDPDLAEYVEQTRLAEEMSSPAEAVRYLLRIQMAATPMDGVVVAAKLRVIEHVRRWALTKVNLSLEEMQREIMQAGFTLENLENPS